MVKVTVQDKKKKLRVVIRYMIYGIYSGFLVNGTSLFRRIDEYLFPHHLNIRFYS
jgi:hypothetical protein